MTWFSSLGARRFALLAVVFVVGVACAKVDRDYGDDGALAGADSGGSSGAGESGGGGKAGAGTAGKPSGGSSSDAGSAGEPSEAGSGGENTAGAGGAPEIPDVSLTIMLKGDGTGKVTSDLPGIDCGTTCSADFDPGTQVVLTATPAANSTFTGWSGGGCSGTGTCTTVVSEATAVTATFTSIKVTLTVALAGTGTGVVKSVPVGIECGTTCSLEVPIATLVKLTATPAAGSIFAGWSGGGCSGTDACTTTMNTAAAVAATFTLTPTLTVVKAGTGLGTVTSVPAGISCGTDCSEAVTYGTIVTLSAAVTGTGSVFTGWSGGGCTGTGTCVVTVIAATQVTATFTCSAGTTTYNYSGVIASFAIPTCVTSLTIDAYGAQGGSAGTYAGGYGARMKGTLAVTGGSTLKVLVGGKGADATDTLQQGGGSGGGGTFVTTSTNGALVVAGGGGGAINNTSGSWLAAGLGGSIGTAGLADSTATNPGGINGNGGTTDANAGYHSGTGGGGLLGNGVGNSNGSFGSAYSPGLAFVNGGAGGLPGTCGTSTSCLPGRPGGFGGGGAAGYSGGGGGGYSGGAAGHTNLSTTGAIGNGGGGGSYNGGTAQTNTAATRIGNGLVIFTY